MSNKIKGQLDACVNVLRKPLFEVPTINYSPFEPAEDENRSRALWKVISTEILHEQYEGQQLKKILDIRGRYNNQHNELIKAFTYGQKFNSDGQMLFNQKLKNPNEPKIQPIPSIKHKHRRFNKSRKPTILYDSLNPYKEALRNSVISTANYQNPNLNQASQVDKSISALSSSMDQYKSSEELYQDKKARKVVKPPKIRKEKSEVMRLSQISFQVPAYKSNLLIEENTESPYFTMAQEQYQKPQSILRTSTQKSQFNNLALQPSSVDTHFRKHFKLIRAINKYNKKNWSVDESWSNSALHALNLCSKPLNKDEAEFERKLMFAERKKSQETQQDIHAMRNLNLLRQNYNLLQNQDSGPTINLLNTKKQVDFIDMNIDGSQQVDYDDEPPQIPMIPGEQYQKFAQEGFIMYKAAKSAGKLKTAYSKSSQAKWKIMN